MTLKDFLLRSFTDQKGQPDGKMITMFVSFSMLVVCACVVLLGGAHLPEYMWATFAGITLFGIGAQAYEFKQQAKADAAKKEERRSPEK
jgi:hypothetical protein